MIKLNCPSCGGALELPDNLGVAHCMYCGSKILLEQTGASHELQDLNQFIRLSEVALDAKNHNEAIQYCNKILEIDPNRIETWIVKAKATFWLTTVADNRFDEAMEYLKQAAQIAPGDERISKTREELILDQSWWYNYLGNEESQAAIRSDLIAQYNKAMNYYLLATCYNPEDMTILKNIQRLSKASIFMTWGDAVHLRLKVLDLLHAKRQAKVELPKLKEKLQKAEADLSRLHSEKGLFSGIKLKDKEALINNLEASIAKNEKDASYVPQY